MKFKSARKRLSHALNNPIEMLEGRLFLSISGAALYGPYTQAGTKWTYSTTDTAGDNSSYTLQVIGPGSFNGQSAEELDAGVGTVLPSKSYLGVDSAGDIVVYGNTTTGDNGNSDTDSYSPYQVGLPGKLTAGVPATFTNSETDTTVNSAGTTTENDNDSETFTLASETPTTMTVGAGTYKVYQVNFSETDTQTSSSDGSTSDPSTDTETDYFAAGVGLVKDVSADGTVIELTAFDGGGKLAFTQQPADVAANQNFKAPVQVSIEDKTGAVDTNNNSTVVTITATGGPSNNQVINATATAVNGVATFTNLELSAPGTYTLSASDGPDTSATSDSFKVEGLHLSFAKQPTNANVGDQLYFDLQLLDDDNKIVTSDSSHVIQYSLTNVDNGQVTVLTPQLQLTQGENNQTTKNGLDHLIAEAAGTFTLTAQEIDSSDNSVNTTITPAVSNNFTVTGNHLIFKKQPANADTNVSIPFIVNLEDSKNKIVTTESTNDVEFTITNTADGSSDLFGTLGLVNGVVTGPAGAGGLRIPSAGTYTLTATQVDPDGTVLTGTTPVTSKPFTVTGDHLVFKQQPADADIDAPIRFTVELLDAKNKLVVSESTNQVEYIATSLASNEVGSLGEPVTLNEGVDDEQSRPAGSALTIPLPGTYTLSVDEITPDGNPVDATLPATSKTFKVNGLHLVFSKQPINTSVNEPLHFAVELEDAKNKVVTTENTNAVFYQLNTEGSAGTLAGPQQVTLVNGVDNELTNTGTAAYSVDRSGGYTLSAFELKPDGTEIDTTELATSNSFTISNDHLVFTKKPTTTDVDVPVPFIVSLEDAKNKVVTSDSSDGLDVTIGGSAAGATLGAPTEVPLTSGVYNNIAAVDAITIPVPGTYTLSINEVDADGTAVDSTDSISSLPFKVLGFHLVFVAQPGSTSVDTPLSFKVELEDSKNKLLDEETSDELAYTLTPVADTSNTTLDGQTTAPLVNGVDENSARQTTDQLSIAVAGTYTLTVKEVAPDGSLIAITSPATSKKFVIKA